MSDQTREPGEFTAARERERLGDEFREAYRRDRKTGTGPSLRLDAAVDAIRANTNVFSRPDTPENFIEAIERQVEFELNIEVGRQRLAQALDDTHKQIAELARQISRMSSNEEYDDEIADGDTASMQAALTGLRVNLAALRGLTRFATPENRP